MVNNDLLIDGLLIGFDKSTCMFWVFYHERIQSFGAVSLPSCLGFVIQQVMKYPFLTFCFYAIYDFLSTRVQESFWKHFCEDRHEFNFQTTEKHYQTQVYLNRLTSPHVLDLWCCGVGRGRSPGRLHSNSHQVDNPFGSGKRIGEASNPGPDTPFTISLVNPTSILTRSQDIADLQSDVTALSETSATSSVQFQFRQAMRAHGQSCLYSAPVGSQKQRLDGLISDRGLASGTAVVSRVPMRPYLPQTPVGEQHSTRLQTAMIQLGATPVLLIVIYGFQQNIPQAKKKTNQLLTEVVEILLDHKGPSMILGDFNHDFDDLPSLLQLREAGYYSLLDIHKSIYGAEMSHTYREQSTRDFAILSHEIASAVESIEVIKDSTFPGHCPIRFVLQLPEGGITKKIWKTPKDWTELSVNETLLEKEFQALPDFEVSGDPMVDLTSWSMKVETAVDLALKAQHAISAEIQPHNGLPKSYRGRCQPNPIKTAKFRNFGKPGRNGDFAALGEIRSVKATQILRQARRLESLRRRLTKKSTYDVVWESTIKSLNHEWIAIHTAKGFGKSFSNWVIHTLGWPAFPLAFPPIEIVEALEEAVKLAFQEKYNEDMKQHQKQKISKNMSTTNMDMIDRLTKQAESLPSSSYKV